MGAIWAVGKGSNAAMLRLNVVALGQGTPKHLDIWREPMNVSLNVVISSTKQPNNYVVVKQMVPHLVRDNARAPPFEAIKKFLDTLSK